MWHQDRQLTYRCVIFSGCQVHCGWRGMQQTATYASPPCLTASDCVFLVGNKNCAYVAHTHMHNNAMSDALTLTLITPFLFVCPDIQSTLPLLTNFPRLSCRSIIQTTFNFEQLPHILPIDTLVLQHFIKQYFGSAGGFWYRLHVSILHSTPIPLASIFGAGL